MIAEIDKLTVTVGLELDEYAKPQSTIYDAFVRGLESRQVPVELKRSGTIGSGKNEAMVLVVSPIGRWLYPHVAREQVNTIIEKHLVEGRPVTSWGSYVTDNFNVPLLTREKKSDSLLSFPTSPAGLPAGKSLKKPKSHTTQAHRAESPIGREASGGESSGWMDANLIGLSWTIGLAILLGVFGGYWLDNLFNTQPLFLLIGLGIGLLLAGLSTYNLIVKVTRSSRKGAAKKPVAPQLKDVVNEIIAVKQESEQRFKEMQSNGRTIVENAARNVNNDPARHISEQLSWEQFLAQAKEKIEGDKLEAMRKLKQEYDKLITADDPSADMKGEPGEIRAQDAT
jgi:F0F1-type ATP synthase assembly protein I/(2Fe-2S) ferredoxin